MPEITTKNQALELLVTLPNRIKQSKANIFQKKKVFKIKVLSSPVGYSGPRNETDSSKDITTVGRDSVYLFKGRILDRNMAHEKYLEDPCDPAIAGSTAASVLQSLHSNIIVHKDAEMPMFDVGDIVFAELEPGDNNNIYDLQFMTLKRVRDVFPFNNGESIVEKCTSIADNFVDDLQLMVSFGTDPVEVPSEEYDVLRGEITNPNNIQLIYWYSGVPAETYGKAYVTGEIRRGLIGNNKVIIVGENNSNYQTLENEATTAFEANGWGPPTSTILGGWSGGGNGAGSHLQARGASSFDRVILADPYPYYTLTTAAFDSNTEMLYNINNWDPSSYPTIGDDFERLVNSINGSGGTVRVVPLVEGSTSHFQILTDALSTTIG